MAALADWDDEPKRRETHRLAMVRRAEEAYEHRLDDQATRAATRLALMQEFAGIAERMAALAGRAELSAQQIAAARELTAQGERVLRQLAAER
jgi:Lon protease-like protein